MPALLIEGGRIIDPGQEIDDIGSVLIAEGKVTPSRAKELFDEMKND